MWSLKKAIVWAVAVLIVAASTAQADTLEVTVPFAFTVEGRTMPAGTYRLDRNESTASVILIRGAEGARPQMFVLTTPAAGRNPGGQDPALIFVPSEDGYQLVGVWESSSAGHELPASGDVSPRVARTIVFAHRLS